METSTQNTPQTPPVAPPPAPKKKTDPLAIVMFLIALGLTLWSSFGDHFPTTQIINFQAKIFDGSYYVKLTFLLTLLVYLLPLLGVKLILDKTVLKKKD
jgi:hypothetical protein